MFATSSRIQSVIGDFRIDSMMRYSLFVPRLYNPCKSPGFLEEAIPQMKKVKEIKIEL